MREKFLCAQTMPSTPRIIVMREHRVTWGLEVEGHHLAAGVPEDLRHVITGVHPAPFRIDTAHLPFVIAARLVRE